MNIDKIEKECQRIEEDATHSSKGHYNASSFLSKIHYSIGIPIVVMSSLAGIDVFNGDAKFAGYLALVTAILAALQTFIKAEEKSVKHKNSGDEFNNLKNESRILREIEINTLSETQLAKRIKLLSLKCGELNKTSLQIPKYAFKQAKKGIDKGESTYVVDVSKATNKGR